MSAYRAAVLRDLGGPSSLRVEEIERTPLGEDEARIRVLAAGANFPDLLMSRGLYQLKPDLPFTPGMEVAGEVVEVCGPARIAVGDRVIAMLRFGGFSEEVTAPTRDLQMLPAALTPAEGACFSVAFVTAYDALVHRARLAEGETLLVLGATGGVGMAAVRIGRLLGARVLAAGSTPKKLAEALAAGADAAVPATDDLKARVSELTGGAGADVVFDPVGGTATAAAVRALAWGGRVLGVGFASGEIPTVSANALLLKAASFVGVRAGEAARRDPVAAATAMRRLLAWAEIGELRPHVSRRFALDGAGDALAALEARQVTGRAVIEMTEGKRA